MVENDIEWDHVVKYQKHLEKQRKNIGSSGKVSK